jgi:hypothetical protein
VEADQVARQFDERHEGFPVPPARALVFSRWIAGVHREGRDGFAVGNDYNEMLSHFLAACDMTAVILEPF